MASYRWKNLGLFLLGLSPAICFRFPDLAITMGGVCLLLSVGMLLYLRFGAGEVTYGAPRDDPAPKAEYLLFFPSFLGLVAVLRDRPLVAGTLILPAAGAASLLTLALAIAVVRGRQACGLGAYFGLAAFAAVFGGLCACFVNNGLDRSPGQTSAVRVTRHYVQHGRSSSFQVEVTPFPDAGRGRSITVSSGYFDRHPIGSSAQLTLHPGLLGAAWFQLR